MALYRPDQLKPVWVCLRPCRLVDDMVAMAVIYLDQQDLAAVKEVTALTLRSRLLLQMMMSLLHNLPPTTTVRAVVVLAVLMVQAALVLTALRQRLVRVVQQMVAPLLVAVSVSRVNQARSGMLHTDVVLVVAARCWTAIQAGAVITVVVVVGARLLARSSIRAVWAATP